MAKYLLHPKHPLRTIIYIILALGLVVGGIVTFKASQTSTEGRSKAAQEGKFFARWEFNGVTTEGWNHLGLQSLSVLKGKLNAVMSNTPSTSYIMKNNVGAPMDQGIKKLNFRMAVGKSAPIIPPNNGPTPTYALTDDIALGDGGQVDCGQLSNGVSTCSTSGDTSSQPGQSESGTGSGYISPDESDGSSLPPNPGVCVIPPTCAPGVDCLSILSEPIGGWCPVGTPTPTLICTPMPPPCDGDNCPPVPFLEPPAFWCPPGTPVPTPPPCQIRPTCLDKKPACKKLTPIGGWCPTNEFTFDVMYAYEEGSIGGGQGGGPGGPIRVEKVLNVKGKANGKFYTYNLALPEIQALKIVDLKITFSSGVNLGSRVVFDWIRLTGGKKGGRVPPPTGIIRATWTPDQCGKRCNNDSGCTESLTCIQPVTVQCQGLGCRTKPAKKVCALAPAHNAKGYTCEAGEN